MRPHDFLGRIVILLRITALKSVYDCGVSTFSSLVTIENIFPLLQVRAIKKKNHEITKKKRFLKLS